jgi:AraC-like DNA-binding protein
MTSSDAQYIVETYSNAEIPPEDTRAWMESFMDDITFPSNRGYPDGLEARIDNTETDNYRVLYSRLRWTPGGKHDLCRTERHIRRGVESGRCQFLIPLPPGGRIKYRNDKTEASGLITPGVGSFQPFRGDPMRMEIGGPVENTLAFELPLRDIRHLTGRSGLMPVQVDLSTGMGRVAVGMIGSISSQRHNLQPHEFDLLCGEVAKIISMVIIGDDHPPAGPAVEALVREYVRRHAGDPNLSSRSIARALGWSLRHLERIMSRGGATPSDIIRIEKMDLALDHLQNPACKDLSIDEIARGVGFSPRYFRREFRRRYGMTPREARYTHRLDLGVRLVRILVGRRVLRCGCGRGGRVPRRRRRRRRAARARGVLVLEEAPRGHAEGIREPGHLVDAYGVLALLPPLDGVACDVDPVREVFLGEAACFADGADAVADLPAVVL